MHSSQTNARLQSQLASVSSELNTQHRRLQLTNDKLSERLVALGAMEAETFKLKVGLGHGDGQIKRRSWGW